MIGSVGKIFLNLFWGIVLLSLSIAVPKISVAQQTDLPKERIIWNIGILLPFKLETTVPANLKANEKAIFDFQQGLEIARCELADSNITLNLLYYDTQGSPVITNTILCAKEFENVDAIIGPVTGHTVPLVAEYARKNKVVMLNPLSSKLYWQNDNEYAFLGTSTPQTLATKAALFALKNFPSEKIGITYGPTERDSIMAKVYQKVMVDSGKSVVLFHKVGKNSAANLTKFISQSGLDSTGHLFAPNNEKLVKLQLISAVQSLKIKTPILTWGDWIEDNNAIYTAFEQAQVHFFWPDGKLVDFYNYKNFTRSFLRKYGKHASKEAAAGYEDLWIIAKGLSIAGKSGLKNWLRQPQAIKAKLIGGYLYQKQADNQDVPFFKFKEGELIELPISE